MCKVETTLIDGSYYTTHSFNKYNGDGVSLTDFRETLKREYESAGYDIFSMRTYYNNGYNSTTDLFDKESEFGIEVNYV